MYRFSKCYTKRNKISYYVHLNGKDVRVPMERIRPSINVMEYARGFVLYGYHDTNTEFPDISLSAAIGYCECIKCKSFDNMKAEYTSLNGQTFTILRYTKKKWKGPPLTASMVMEVMAVLKAQCTEAP